jgi:hypothetical protein
MDKEKTLQLIGNLARASVHHYAVVNGHKRGSADKASRLETTAATKLYKAIMGNESVSDAEIESALA